MCKLTNPDNEVRDIVAVIRGALVGTMSADNIAAVTAALTHLCNMTENLKHHADVSSSAFSVLYHKNFLHHHRNLIVPIRSICAAPARIPTQLPSPVSMPIKTPPAIVEKYRFARGIVIRLRVSMCLH